jgi:hypothetical protein
LSPEPVNIFTQHRRWEILPGPTIWGAKPIVLYDPAEDHPRPIRRVDVH